MSLNDIRVKSLTTPKKLPESQQIRDTFHTPSYATKLLVPFIPANILNVWECAYGAGKISRILREAGYTVFESDIVSDDPKKIYNFITGDRKNIPDSTAIITNPPFSVKEMFISRCFEYDVPFALLINADYSQWSIDLVMAGCEKIIPNRRISYLTPHIIKRVHEGEVYSAVKKDYPQYDNLTDFKKKDPELWDSIINSDEYKNFHRYEHRDDIPGKLMKKYSASQFHSMWLTYKFNLGRSETFVDLPLENLEDF